MTFETNLTLKQMTAVPELYEFSYAGNYDRYTSFPEEITFLGFTWKRGTIKRTGFTVDTEFGKISMTIQAPILPTLQTYIGNYPVEVTSVTVYRALYSDLTDYRILFTGEVQNVSFKDNVAQAVCEMQSHQLRQMIPNIVHQAYCNHQVFDDECELDWSSWRAAATISGITSDKYTSPTFGLQSSGYYIGGQLIKDNDARYIIDHIGNDVWLHVPFDTRVSVGTTVWAIPGCDGAPATCQNKFNNWGNFLAMPYIPSSNPVLWGFK